MRVRLGQALLLLLLLAAVSVVPRPSVAWAGSSGNCTWTGVRYDCITNITHPGSPATTVPSSGSLTPGSTSCEFDGKTVPCSNKYGAFINDAACAGYVALATDQPSPPSGELAGSGAWYECTFICAALQDPLHACPAGVSATDYWSTTPPAGVDQYTPAQAAAALARTFRLTPITIGMAPARKTHHDDPPGTAAYRRTWVGVPVWLWVANPKPLTYGPYAQTATLGGVTVTARATVTQVDWTSGDGDHVTCGAGTPYDPSTSDDQAATDSPTCGFRYQHTSTGRPGNDFTVTATSHWTVSWTGGGQTGTLQLTNLTATTPVQVGELQSVNLPITTNQIGSPQ